MESVNVSIKSRNEYAAVGKLWIKWIRSQHITTADFGVAKLHNSEPYIRLFYSHRPYMIKGGFPYVVFNTAWYEEIL
jgi:hypothetical protein